MAETEDSKTERRVCPDKMDEEFCKDIRKIVGWTLRGYGEYDEQRIADVSQDTLEELWKKGKLSWQAVNKIYIQTAIYHRWLKVLAKNRRYDSITDMPAEAQEDRHSHRHPIRPSEQEVDVSLREELHGLSEEDSKTFKLLAEGKDYGDIAKDAGISEVAARQRGSRLKRRFDAEIPKRRGKRKNHRD